MEEKLKNGEKISSGIGGKKLGGGDNSDNPSALRDLRRAAGLSLSEVAEASSIPYRKLGEIEGRRRGLRPSSGAARACVGG